METALQGFAAVLAIISRHAARRQIPAKAGEKLKNLTKLPKNRAKSGKVAKNSREEQG